MKRLALSIGVPLLVAALGVGAPAAVSAHGWHGAPAAAAHGGWHGGYSGGGHGGGWRAGVNMHPGYVAPAYPYYRVQRGSGYPGYGHYPGYGRGAWVGPTGAWLGFSAPFLGWYWAPDESAWDGSEWDSQQDDDWSQPY